MPRVVVSRKHGKYDVRSEVVVDGKGSPSISMDLQDFLNAVTGELDSMTFVFSKAETDKRIAEAFDRVVARMKQDTVPLAKYIR